jgi:hypothetical protein
LIDKLRNKEAFQVVEHGTNVDITNKTLKQALVTVEISNEDIRRVVLGE